MSLWCFCPASLPLKAIKVEIYVCVPNLEEQENRTAVWETELKSNLKICIRVQTRRYLGYRNMAQWITLKSCHRFSSNLSVIGRMII